MNHQPSSAVTDRRRRAYPVTRPAQPHKPLALIHTRGSQAEMGAQHARALRQLGGYDELLEFYTELPERIILSADSYTRPNWIVRKAARALKDVLLRRLERQRPAAYLARSRAFMEEIGLPVEHARFIAVMDVMQNVVGLAGRFGVGPFPRIAAEAAVPACSTLIAWGSDSDDGSLRHARNFDFPGVGVWDRGPAVVFCEPDDGLRYGFATSRGADTPGVSAFNEAGISVTMHTRFHRDVAFDGACVVDLGHDIARRAETLADAVAIAKERPVASTWGIAVSSAREQRAVVIETTARTVAVVEPSRGDHLSCANRYRHGDTRRGQVAASAAWEVHSTGRQCRLEALVDQARPAGGMTLGAMQSALDDHYEPSAPERARGAGAVVSQPCTVKSIVVEPDQRAIHVSVAPAPTGRGPYARVAWDWDAAVGGVELGEAIAPEPRDDAERATAHYVEACRLDRQMSDRRGASIELEKAVALVPDDPSYRLLAGFYRMRSRAYAEALVHFEAGLAHETVPFRRGQLLLWGSRAADCKGDAVRAGQLRAELLAMDHDDLVDHRAAAGDEERRPYDPRKRRVQINMLLGDAS